MTAQLLLIQERIKQQVILNDGYEVIERAADTALHVDMNGADLFIVPSDEGEPSKLVILTSDGSAVSIPSDILVGLM